MQIQRFFNRSKQAVIPLFLVQSLFTVFMCQPNKKITDPIQNIGKGFMTALPLRPEDFYLFVNLGHMSQPGHVFPSDHGGFYLTDYMTPKPVLCPAGMYIVRITVTEHVNERFSDYAVTLSANGERFQIVFGHLSRIRDSILEQAEAGGVPVCDTYSTGGNTFRNCSYSTAIPVSAGDTLGAAGGNPGQFGLDFGVYDRTGRIKFASGRFDNSQYPYTVSPLDYFTDEIRDVLIPKCGDYLCGRPTFRTEPPVGGTVDFDIPGTAQGLWYKPGEPTYPEDPHLALVRHNADPGVPVFSVGVSLTGLDPGTYTFSPADTGFVNRIFSGVQSDGRIYRYRIRFPCEAEAAAHAVLLVQLTDASHMKIEKQDPAAGPPWAFTSNAVMYER
jgi:hypothetical protein